LDYKRSVISRVYLNIKGDDIMAVLSPPTRNTISINKGYLRAKRIFDIVFTLLILLPLCVVIAIFAVLILIDSKGSIFFRQKRVGLNGVEFEMLKLRSMYEKCDDRSHRDAIQQYMNGQTLNGNTETPYKLHDGRITRVGRFLRKASIDEFPQFWNVLRGEMSLVGPRPPIPYEVELYTSHDWLRLSGKPGLTGPWQVYGRSRTTFQDMIELDIAYLQKQSIWTDVKLIALTIPVIITGRGGA